MQNNKNKVRSLWVPLSTYRQAREKPKIEMINEKREWL
jgi:hypothetical protein